MLLAVAVEQWEGLNAMSATTLQAVRHGRGYMVNLESQEIYLTGSEFRLLNALHREPRRAFTRAELISIVMPETLVFERTIDVHIRSLRRKLGPAAAQIETVGRVGYRFVARHEFQRD
jgi:two-component system phosphate regulon response regulator PhoB